MPVAPAVTARVSVLGLIFAQSWIESHERHADAFLLAAGEVALSTRGWLGAP
jgi:hypothetical protein